MPRQRKQTKPNMRAEQAPLLPSDSNPTPTKEKKKMAASYLTNLVGRQPQWLILAVASGACAAFNGVFAKLTTTSLTSSIASHIHSLLHLPDSLASATEFTTRLTFFLLNLAFNAVMWALFTAALTRANSTTRVSIINTSANFLVTALAGWAVFGEGMSGLWFLGAGLLVAGVVVIGRREEGEKMGVTVGVEADVPRGSGERYRDADAEGGGEGLAEGEDFVELEGEVVK